MRGVLKIAAIVALSAWLAACQDPNRVTPEVMSAKPAVELRAMQTRAFDTTDRNKVLRAVVSTLQDIGYGIDKVDSQAGTISATKFEMLKLSAAVYPKGTTQTVVRANAMVTMPAASTQVDDPLFYQQRFFEPLSKSLFLQALEETDKEAANSSPP